MLGLGKKNLDNEDVKNPPSDDSYPIISTLYSKNNKITVNTLSLTILDLINKNQIKCEIDLNESYNVGKKLTQDDMEVMKKITLRIANKGELKTSETIAINLLKTINKNKKFNLKNMAKQSNNTANANKFEKDFVEYVKALKNENGYDDGNYRNLLENGKLTKEGKEAKKSWNNFKDYLKSEELTGKYPPESAEENSSQIIYGSCFDIEKDALKLRENNTNLTDFIDKDGYKLLNIIFNNALSNVSKKSKGTGIFYGVNDKYTIPGGG
ncbi:hypothetical protein TL18_01345 [Methanobrevibacter sp. YE315]|uniref:DUF2207 family protein n=1 Tax=Methanobrevibacter sp. YE315 TaxID=1609968 RepID=UPI000764DD43|nr:DUF2207 domain-containing protein [Methanobrevibacter sp. YE315]AMD16803.1 hypothetical protein TL18_01345 [Methanobrevibacter sp. YE315]